MNLFHSVPSQMLEPKEHMAPRNPEIWNHKVPNKMKPHKIISEKRSHWCELINFEELYVHKRKFVFYEKHMVCSNIIEMFRRYLDHERNNPAKKKNLRICIFISNTTEQIFP